MQKINEQNYIEEYKYIYTEIIKRVELSHVILNIVFVSVGVLWGAGFVYSKPAIFGIYPIILLVLALGYSANATVLSTLGHYMREVLEKDIYELNWATYFRNINKKIILLNKLFVFSIFVLLSVVSLGLYYSAANLTLSESFTSVNKLLLLGIICTVITSYILYRSLSSFPSNIYEKVSEIRAEKNKTHLENDLSKLGNGEEKKV
jgi:hypothetical protein